jgi:ribosome-associated protein
MSLQISNQISIPLSEIDLQAIRAKGPGGQNVNKLASAIHLRFDIDASSLPDVYKEQLRQLRDKRISSEGIIVIKAQRFRSQEKNRADALERLRSLVKSAGSQRKRRVPTRPSRRSREKRLDNKTRRGQLKSLRSRVPP